MCVCVFVCSTDVCLYFCLELSKERNNLFVYFYFYFFTDDVPGLPRPFEEYDLLVRPRNLSDVRRSDVRVSDLQEDRREENPALLDP